MTLQPKRPPLTPLCGRREKEGQGRAKLFKNYEILKFHFRIKLNQKD
jgi:hypothetical protein